MHLSARRSCPSPHGYLWDSIQHLGSSYMFLDMSTSAINLSSYKHTHSHRWVSPWRCTLSFPEVELGKASFSVLVEAAFPSIAMDARTPFGIFPDFNEPSGPYMCLSDVGLTTGSCFSWWESVHGWGTYIPPPAVPVTRFAAVISLLSYPSSWLALSVNTWFSDYQIGNTHNTCTLS